MAGSAVQRVRSKAELKEPTVFAVVCEALRDHEVVNTAAIGQSAASNSRLGGTVVARSDRGTSERSGGTFLAVQDHAPSDRLDTAGLERAAM